MVLTLSGLVMIVGLLMYALAVNGKVVEIGRIMFAFGLLAVLLNSGALLNVLPTR